MKLYRSEYSQIMKEAFHTGNSVTENIRSRRFEHKKVFVLSNEHGLLKVDHQNVTRKAVTLSNTIQSI